MDFKFCKKCGYKLRIEAFYRYNRPNGRYRYSTYCKPHHIETLPPKKKEDRDPAPPRTPAKKAYKRLESKARYEALRRLGEMFPEEYKRYRKDAKSTEHARSSVSKNHRDVYHWLLDDERNKRGLKRQIRRSKDDPNYWMIHSSTNGS